MKFLISGGGTGGHIFPAVSIANALKKAQPDAEILFIGADGRMEMQRVPQAGYEIKGLPIMGFDRKHILKNIKVLVHLWKSQRMARKIIREGQDEREDGRCRRGGRHRGACGLSVGEGLKV